MESKTKTHIVFSTFFVVVIAMAVAVLLAVYFHKEPEFAVNGMVWYGKDVPLRVCIQPYEANADSAKEAKRIGQQVTELINKRVNIHLLVYVGETSPDCVIFGTLGVPEDVKSSQIPANQYVIEKGGHARWQPYAKCEFRTSNPPPGTEGLTVEHELGHCLGLDHDPYPSSIMYGSTHEQTKDDAKSNFPPEISDDDVKAIRSRYIQKTE